MILKLASIAVALFAATPMEPPFAVAAFVYGLNDRGQEVFELQVPASQWENFAHGEPLDVAHQDLGPQTRRAVYDYLDRAVRKAGICTRAGWLLSVYELDLEDTRHFKGACKPKAVSA